ncbi:hypothetical protein HOLleu_18147 [Holothuria leucospilota]|uniref:HTH CENPB-type domain-containing protein n=1 Tax=Holothuria leucospilota TaxID=206669 RepID=A0A9Q1H8V8_HOLLE|nr:hypothetical protein HOLleu_18147 [Holothuria leucospilota]
MTCTLGAPTVLTIENQLAEWVIKMAKIGYGRTRQELTLTVKHILDQTDRPNPFRNNLPGRHWVEGFLQRHKNISRRTTEVLGRERASITSAKLDRWFDEFEAYIKGVDTEGDLGILANPMRIFNADESGFALVGKSENVLALKGSKVVYNLTTSDKSQITRLACCNAEHYDEIPEDWIGCPCGRWLHKGCSDISDVHELTDEEIAVLDWYCEWCAAREE